MAENDKCAFCSFGTVMWIHMPAEITTNGEECFQLYCTDCGAHGVFVRKETKEKPAGDVIDGILGDIG